MAKKKPRRHWAWVPAKLPKPKVPEKIKTELEAKAAKLVADVLTPKYIQPPPEDCQFNYPIKVWTKWNRSFFYFTSTWDCPGPNAISPIFESPFARMEYTADGLFNLAYFRHTNQWAEIFSGLTMDECLKLVAEDGPFTLA